MKRPNFFIVGARRCGTTALYNYLKKHPDIYMPNQKELHYFGSDLVFEQMVWNDDVDKYLAHFSGAKKEKMIGEASPYYLFSKKAAKEIWKFCPDAKIIIQLRNPVEQAYSSYNQLLFLGVEKKIDFEKALLAEKRRKITDNPYDNFRNALLSYCYVANYYKQVKRFIDVFGKKIFI